MNSKKILFLVEVAIFTALATVLDNIPFLKFTVWPNGGSVSFAMIPVFIVAFRWGLGGGLLSGFLFGMLKMVFGPTILHLYQAFIEYGFAFTVLGLAGLFSAPLQKAIQAGNSALSFFYVMIGIMLGAGLRYVAHIYAGIVFWSEAAPEDQPVWLYSVIYNGTFMLPAFIICTIGIFLLLRTQPKIVTQ